MLHKYALGHKSIYYTYFKQILLIELQINIHEFYTLSE